MSQKRKPPSSSSGSLPHPKRTRVSYAEDDLDDEDTQNSVTPYERPRNHPVFGQKGAFPGLDTGDGDELFYGPAEDGLEYLRMVRSEANALPTLFTAPAATELATEAVDVTGDNAQARDQAQKKEEDEKISLVQRVPEGIFSDGVYISLTATKPATNGEFSDAQANYYNLLHHRFLLLRSILKCTPPSEAISTLDDSHPISFPRRSKTAQKEWRRLLLTVDPRTVQLACMDMDTVLGVLGIMARLMSENVRSGNAVLVRRIGAWAWGLLGKCRDAGQLGAEEIGDIRELGKRAVKILGKMREEMEGQEGEEEEEEDGYESDTGDGNNDDGRMDTTRDDNDLTVPPVLEQPDAEKETDAEELERAKERLEARISAAGDKQTPQGTTGDEAQIKSEDSSIDARTRTRAMLDMIITVIGEHYGQRDLLEAREIWTEAEQRFCK